MNKSIINRKGLTMAKFPEDVLGVIENYGHDRGMTILYNFCKLFNSSIELKSLISDGNMKIPSTTAIFNMSSATNCPSLALGLCKAQLLDKNGKLKSVCYAMKSERDYRPNVFPYRERQKEFWLGVSPEEFVKQFVMINSSKVIKFDKVRLNESGDFHNQGCVKKAERISKLLLDYGIVTYCYTSRSDLDFSRTRRLVINASGFKSKGITNDFLMVPKGKKPPKGYKPCPMDCNRCDRCSIRGSKTWVPQH